MVSRNRSRWFCMMFVALMLCASSVATSGCDKDDSSADTFVLFNIPFLSNWVGGSCDDCTETGQTGLWYRVLRPVVFW